MLKKGGFCYVILNIRLRLETFLNSIFDLFFGIFQCYLIQNNENYKKNYIISHQVFKNLKTFGDFLAIFMKTAVIQINE